MRVPVVSRTSAAGSSQGHRGAIHRAAFKSLWIAYPLHLLGAGGGLGLHRFYLGYTRSAAAMLALFVINMALSMSSLGRVEIFGIWLMTVSFVPLFGWTMLDLFLMPSMCRAQNRAIASRIDGEFARLQADAVANR